LKASDSQITAQDRMVFWFPIGAAALASFLWSKLFGLSIDAVSVPAALTIVFLVGNAFAHSFRRYEIQKNKLDKIENEKVRLKVDFIYEQPPDIGIDAFRLRITNLSTLAATSVQVVLDDVISDGMPVSYHHRWPLALTFVPQLYSIGEYIPGYERDINPGNYERFEVASYFVEKPDTKFIGLPPLAPQNKTMFTAGLVFWRPSHNLIALRMPCPPRKAWHFRLRISAKNVPAFPVEVFLEFSSENGEDGWATPLLSTLNRSTYSH